VAPCPSRRPSEHPHAHVLPRIRLDVLRQVAELGHRAVHAVVQRLVAAQLAERALAAVDAADHRGQPHAGGVQVGGADLQLARDAVGAGDGAGYIYSDNERIRRSSSCT
jgi:hypothetical protein